MTSGTGAESVGYLLDYWLVLEGTWRHRDEPARGLVIPPDLVRVERVADTAVHEQGSRLDLWELAVLAGWQGAGRPPPGSASQGSGGS